MKNLLLILVLCLAVVPVFAGQANYVKNGDFEDGDVEWLGWGGNKGIADHSADYVGTANMDAGVWWSDAGFYQEIPNIEVGTYTVSGQAIHGTHAPLGNGRQGLIKAEMYYQGTMWGEMTVEFVIDENAPINEWQSYSADIIVEENQFGEHVDMIKIVMMNYDTNGPHTGLGNAYFDNLKLVKKGYDGPIYPNPADGEAVDASSRDILSWTNPIPSIAGNDILCDVAISTDPNVVENGTTLATQQAIDSVSLDAASYTLNNNETYYWQVTVYDANEFAGPLAATKGPVWTFFTGDVAPVISAGEDQFVWESPVDLEGLLISDDGNSTISYAWTLVDGNAENVTINDSDLLDPIATADITAEGVYTFKLTATDASLAGSSEDTVVIGVYADACEAAKADPADELLVGDLNSDCHVNLVDLAIFAENWLGCMSDKLDCIP